jgi:hypothetical protein
MGIFNAWRPPQKPWNKRTAIVQLASLIVAIIIVILTTVIILER